MEAPVLYIEIRDGKAFIRGRSHKVKMVAGMYVYGGATIEQVMEQYGLSRAEVHAALAYYYDNQAAFEQEDREIDAHFATERQQSAERLERMRAKYRQLKGEQ